MFQKQTFRHKDTKEAGLSRERGAGSWWRVESRRRTAGGRRPDAGASPRAAVTEMSPATARAPVTCGRKICHEALPTLWIALGHFGLLPELLHSGSISAHAMVFLHRDRLGLRGGRFSCGDGRAVKNTATHSGTRRVTQAVRCVLSASPSQRLQTCYCAAERRRRRM